MKTSSLIVSLAVCGASGFPGKLLAQSNSQVIERGRHYTVVQSVRQETNGLQAVLKTNRYTLLGNGINIQDSSGNFAAATPAVWTYPNVIVCTGAAYRVVLNRNLNTAGAVDLLTGDGQRIISNPLGIGFFDPESGRSVLLATLQDSQAIVSSNRIIYPDVFQGSGIRASVVYDYKAGHFHQDVVFSTWPSTLTPEAFGLGPRTRIELMTEIVQSPVPTRSVRILGSETSAALRANMVEPDIVDETLTWGREITMVLGRAFGATSRTNGSLVVAKRLLSINGRQILIETLPWRKAQPELAKLPVQTASASEPMRGANLQRSLPEQRPFTKEPFETRTADATQATPLLVSLPTIHEAYAPSAPPDRSTFTMDYELVEGCSSWEFLSGETYLVAEGAYIDDVTLHPGAVIKFGMAAGIIIDNSVTCEAGFGKTILTAKDDDSVGAVLDESAHIVSGRYGVDGMLQFDNVPYDFELANLDIRHAWRGISIFSYGAAPMISNCRFGDCYQAVVCNASENSGEGTWVSLDSCQMCGVDEWWSPSTGELPYGGVDGYNITENCDVDLDGDGMWDSWELKYFGNLNQTATGDYDGDGVNNGLEFANGTDPNRIAFSIAATNNYVSTTTTTLQLEIKGGVPSSQAVLLDSTNFSTANWSAYNSSSLSVNLGSVEGWHEMWIGLRGLPADARQTWRWKRLKLDRTPPEIVFTNLASDTVTQPMIQLRGYCPEALSEIRCDLSNDNGVFTNQMILVCDTSYDTNTFEFTTSSIQAFDLKLTNGVNAITIRAVDLAGNVTTLTTNITLVSDTVPPVVQLWWPQNSAELCGGTFTWRGWVDDFTAFLTADVVDSANNHNVRTAIVERDGKFWFEDLPLSDGASTLYLTAVDCWGNETHTNITVSKSAVQLTIDPVGELSYNRARVTVSGTINVNDHSVWVNGKKAPPLTYNGTTWTWSVDEVPVTPGGTAVIQARAIPNDDNGGNGTGGSGGTAASMADPGNPTSPQQTDTGTQPDKSWQLYLEHYERTEGGSTHDEGSFDFKYNMKQELSMHWDIGKKGGGGGHDSYHWDASDDYTWWTTTFNDTLSSPGDEWPVPGTRYRVWDDDRDTRSEPGHGEVPLAWTPLVVREHCNVNVPVGPDTGWPDSWMGSFFDPYSQGEYHRTADARITLFTGGKSSSRNSLWQFSATAQKIQSEISQPQQTDPVTWIPDESEEVLPRSRIGIGNGVGNLGSDGSLYVSLPDGTPFNVTPRVDGEAYYKFSGPTAVKYCLPRMITFEDGPASSTRPFHIRLKLDVVCGWAIDTPLASITWGCDVDVNGNVTPYEPVGGGVSGECDKIIVAQLSTIQPTSSDSRAGVRLQAYFVGCCDDKLRWLQTVTEDSAPPPGKTPPYNDHLSVSDGPFVYPDTGPWPVGMDTRTSDYLHPCQ